MDYQIWAWLGFGAFILTMLSLDLGLFNRTAHVVGYREAASWSAVWISLALSFSALIYFQPEYLGIAPDLAGLKFKEFLTGYLIELSLSVDNLFIFLLIFSYFKVPAQFQHRVLFWGVLGALVMRITMIFLGTALINRFHWILYIFGAFLVYTGIKMFWQQETDLEPEDNPIVKAVTRFIPIERKYHGEQFFIMRDGRRVGTLLLLVLVIVEVTDLVFAVDSIPAIFGITTDPFIIYTSNVFAILGLRSLYFLLAGVVEKFHFLKLGLAIVLTFIGIKMLTEGFVTDYISKTALIEISLVVVAVVLVSSVVLSLIFPKRAETGVGVDLPAGFDAPDSAENETTTPHTVEKS